MNSPVEEIKNRIDIVDFISTYVQLKRAGANFKAKCPFHNEKTPSFMVSKPKQLWYCFGACNEGGDIFKFLMKLEGLEFAEALKVLADKAGVVLPKYDKQAESKKSVLLDVMKEATDFYVQQLNSPLGALARDYLTKRGLSETVLKQFKLGYAPDAWDSLSIAFRDKFKPEDVFAAGLAIRSEKRQGFYDRFRHRIMFPISDIHGQTVGFTSRLLDEARKEGKYINTPETLIYNKSRILYGLDLAREQIRKQDYAVITEGNMDVVACHQFGMINVVASSGTALTLDQIRLLKRYTNNLKIAFDMDPAGENAAKRGIDLAVQQEMRVKVIVIPQSCGKDPDDCIRKDIKVWEGAVREAKEVVEYYVEKAQGEYDLNTAHGRSQFANSLLLEIAKLPDLIEQDFWLKKIGELVGIEQGLLREQMKRIKPKVSGAAAVEIESRPAAVRSRIDLLSERLLAVFLTSPAQAKEIIGNILPEMLSPRIQQELYTNLNTCYTAYNSRSSANAENLNFRQFWRNWAQKAVPELLSTADILELYADKEFDGWTQSQFEQETKFLISELRREYTKGRRVMLTAKMREAEKAGDQARVQELAREFEALSVQTNS